MGIAPARVSRRALLATLGMVAFVAVWATVLILGSRSGAATAEALEDGSMLLSVRGYRDAITLSAKPEGSAFSLLELRSSRESPMYAPPQAIRAYLDRLEGVEALEIIGVDGISGATVTTDAIRGALTQAGNLMQNSVFKDA